MEINNTNIAPASPKQSPREEIVESNLLQQNETYGKHKGMSMSYEKAQLKNQILPKAREQSLYERRIKFIKALINSARSALESIRLGAQSNPELIKENIQRTLQLITASYEDELKARDHFYDEFANEFIKITQETRPDLLKKEKKKFESEAQEFLAIALPENIPKLETLIESWEKDIAELEERISPLLDEKTKHTEIMEEKVYNIKEMAMQSAVKAQSDNALLIAINNKDLKKVTELLKWEDYKKRINSLKEIGGYTKSPLHFACEMGCLDIVKLLVKLGANTKVKGIDDYTAIHYAVRRSNNNSVQILEYLVKELKLNLEAPTSVATRSRTPFLLACYEGNVEAVKALQVLGASYTATEAKTGNNALHIACERGHYDVAVWLSKQGISPFVSNSLRESPVYLAVAHGNSNIAKFFFDAGVWLSKAERELLVKQKLAPWATVDLKFP